MITDITALLKAAFFDTGSGAMLRVPQTLFDKVLPFFADFYHGMSDCVAPGKCPRIPLFERVRSLKYELIFLSISSTIDKYVLSEESFFVGREDNGESEFLFSSLPDEVIMFRFAFLNPYSLDIITILIH